MFSRVVGEIRSWYHVHPHCRLLCGTSFVITSHWPFWGKMADIFEGAFASFGNGQIPNATNVLLYSYSFFFSFSGIRLNFLPFLLSYRDSICRLLHFLCWIEDTWSSVNSPEVNVVHGDIERLPSHFILRRFFVFLFFSPNSNLLSTSVQGGKHKLLVVAGRNSLTASLFSFLN